MTNNIKQNNLPKISVLMAAYNAEKYIAEAIESILNQTFKDFELIIVDDCSTDGTRAIIQKYAIQDDRIRAFRNEKNLYISVTTNRALSYARSEIAAKMDADDIALPTRLEKQYELLRNRPDIAVVGAGLEIMNEEGKTMSVRYYKQNDADLRKKMFRYSPIAQPVVMYRKSVVEEFGAYEPVFAPAEDLNLWFRIGTKYKFANMPEVLMRYRFFENSSSNKRLREVEIKTLKIRWFAWRHQGYRPTLGDVFYNIAQAGTIYMMPIRWRLRLFDVVRRYL
jgi:glycosyltransferase involved in cell wall biosynthesis